MPTILGKGWTLPGTGPPLTFWPFMFGLRTVTVPMSVIQLMHYSEHIIRLKVNWKVKSSTVLNLTDSAAASAAKSLQSCPTLCDPTDCSLAGSSICGSFQARVLEWVASAFSVIDSNQFLSYLQQLCHTLKGYALPLSLLFQLHEQDTKQFFSNAKGHLHKSLFSLSEFRTKLD